MVMIWPTQRVPKVGLACALNKSIPSILLQGLLTALKFLRNYFPNKKEPVLSFMGTPGSMDIHETYSREPYLEVA